MNLNDPFNRLARQRQEEYLKFRDTLKSAEVDSLPGAEALLADIRRRAWRFGAAIALTVLAVSVLFPEAAMGALLFGAVVALWMITNIFKGHRYLKRYIKEEILKE